MARDEVQIATLSTENATLFCSIRDGIPALEFFTFADIYSTYRVNLHYEDLCDICQFLDNWGSKPLEIIQPYSTTVNNCPSFCAVRFEYVENEDKSMIRSEFQRLTFYASCWGKDLEDSLKEEKFLGWSSWDDYYNWEDFEKIRAFVHQIRDLMLQAKEEVE